MVRLDEKTRQELLNKSQNAKPTKTYGTTRLARKNHVFIFNQDAIFNSIDMNGLFKSHTLSLNFPVKGETDNYNVSIIFEKICDAIKNELSFNDYSLEYKVVYKALIKAINNSDIYIGCSCEDFKYTFSYHATRGVYNALAPQLIPANETNPNDDKGAGCKHIMKILDDLAWVVDLAESITNYIYYIDENMHDKYADIIVPAVYGVPYRTAVAKGWVYDEYDDFDDFPDEGEVPEEEPIEEPEPEIEDEPELEEPEITEEPEEEEEEENGV